MQLSQKKKFFSEFFPAFSKSLLNCQNFESIDDFHSFFISEITDSEKVLRYISKKFRFRGRFEKQHRKREQTLLKSASQQSYHLHWPLAT